MSKLIKTRSPKQVKSHHQKLIKQHGSVDSIVEYFSNLFEHTNTLTNSEKVLEKQD